MIDENKYFIKVKVIPKAKRQEVEVLGKNSLKLKVVSKPEKGLANKEAIELLASFFKIPKSKIKLAKGQKSKNKIFCIEKVPSKAISNAIDHTQPKKLKMGKAE